MPTSTLVMGNGQVLGGCGERGCRPWRCMCGGVWLLTVTVHYTGGAVSGSSATGAGKAGLKVVLNRRHNLVMVSRRIVDGLCRMSHLQRRSAGSHRHLCGLPVRHRRVRSGGERYVRRAFILCDYITLMIEVSVLQTRMLSDAGEGDVRITKRLLGCTYLIATRISIHVMTCCIRVSSVIQDVMIVIGQPRAGTIFVVRCVRRLRK